MTGPTCRHCGGPIVRKYRQSKGDWLATRYCSRACFADYRRANHVTPTKACTVCGITFPRPDWMAPSSWSRRQCCSADCANIMRYGARTTDRREDVEWLISQGESPWQIPARVGMTAEAIAAMFRRHGQMGLAQPFYEVAKAERKRVA